MADRYCATLMLPHAACMPVASGARLVFGRSAPMLAACAYSIRHAFCSKAAVPPAPTGLACRAAFSFEATVEAGYKIARISATQALYHLDPDMAFVACIGSELAYLLPHGHHLVAGHYVLRFDA
ncbi:hypothetical protein LP420_01745 [Massilia sp. B-10]|nr:hypothetical protein LP420_01745 [Massilia sp. B-10]